MRRSISRTLSRYSPSRARSRAPTLRCSSRASSATESRMLRFSCMRWRRSACVPARPNIRSNATRGLVSIGCGGVSDAQEMRVHVGAAVAGHAAADVAAEVLGRHLQRRERRVLTDLLREHLIDGDAEADVFRLGLLGDGAAQPARRAHRVIGHGLAAGARQVAERRSL